MLQALLTTIISNVHTMWPTVDMLTLLRSSIVYNQSFDATVRNHASIDATHAIAVTSSSVTPVAASRRRFDGDLSTSVVCCCPTTTRLAVVASKLVITRSCGRPRPAAEVQHLQRRDHPTGKSSGGQRQSCPLSPLPARAVHWLLPFLKQTFCTRTQRDWYNAQAIIITTRKARRSLHVGQPVVWP